MSRLAIVTAALASLAFIFLLVSGAVLSPYSTLIDVAHWHGDPLPPCFIDAKNCAGHVLGTDEIGRDLLARLIVGARVSLGVALLAMVFELVLGLILGALARYGGSFATWSIMRAADALSCFTPWILILLIMMIGFQIHRTGFGLTVLAVVTGVLFSPKPVRMIAFAETLKDTVRPLFSQVARDWGSIILLLATVDFFGYGVQPPTSSWGSMLSSAQETFQLAWWDSVLPAACIFVSVFSIEIARRAFLVQRHT